MSIQFLAHKGSLMKSNCDAQPVTRGEFRIAMEKIDRRLGSHDENFVSFEQRFQSIDQRFEDIDQRFEDIDQRFEDIDQRFEDIDRRFEANDRDHASIKTALKIIIDRCDSIEERMYTKEDHARDLVWMDKAMEEIVAAREERILSTQQLLRMDDRVFDHEKRISSLESR